VVVPGTLLRVEGLVLAVAAVALFSHGDSTWWWFALVLVPDVSFAGYAAGPRVGAVAYDLLHTEVWPVALGTIGVLAGRDAAVAIALVWLVHIGVDRTLGYGLKYPTAFRDTHLQRV